MPFALNKWNSTFTVPDLKIARAAVRYYALTAQQQPPNGGWEFEIELSRKPRRASWSFPFSSKNMRFYYQPPLTEELDPADYDKLTETEAWKNGVLIARRPEHVVGSYAVYHPYLRDNQYECGKLFHIYRPKLIDADGDEAWGSLNIQGSVMTVSAPQQFLDDARYPVVVDPVFGSEVAGGSFHTINGVIRGSWASPASNGTTDTVDAYLDTDGFNETCKTALYNKSDLSLFESGTERNDINSGAGAWFQFTHPGGAVNSANDYWIVVWNDPQVFDADLAYDAADANRGVSDIQAYGAWPDPLVVSSYWGNLYSIHCHYTVSGGQQLFTLINEMSYAAKRRVPPLSLPKLSPLRI